MKNEGFKFPKLNESEAMFDVEEAPRWIEDSDAASCFRCRTEFSTMRRRHHCRACGQIFCHACSSKQAPIPKYGIEKEVRVCDSCFDKLKSAAPEPPAIPKSTQQQPISSSSSSSSSSGPLPAGLTSYPKEKSEQEFEEELQLALALSESEAEAKKKSSYGGKLSSSSTSKSTYPIDAGMSKTNASAPYIEMNTSSKKVNEPTVQQPVQQPTRQQPQEQAVIYDDRNETEEEAKVNAEIFDFREEIKKLLDIYVNRMKSDSMRGRSITNDTAVQSLFLQLQHLHPKLLAYIKYKEDARGYYENLQDKLTQLKDAREALNALRQENYEKKRLEMEEKERIRQIQIAQKLQAMRQQKQSYYLMQNQLNLRKLQDQERELKMRLDQQREMVLKREIVVNAAAPGAVITQPTAYNQLPPNYMQMIDPSMEALRLQQQQQQQQQPQQPTYINPNMPAVQPQQYATQHWQMPNMQQQLPPQPVNGQMYYNNPQLQQHQQQYPAQMPPQQQTQNINYNPPNMAGNMNIAPQQLGPPQSNTGDQTTKVGELISFD